MIQAPAPFGDGTFVLHKIELNGQKYSAWYNKDGTVYSAERFSKDGQKTFNVPLSKQPNVVQQLNKIGRRYTGRGNTGFALKATHTKNDEYDIVVKPNIGNLSELGFIVFDDPATLLADMEAGRRLLNMKYEKRLAIMAHLRTMMTPAVGV